MTIVRRTPGKTRMAAAVAAIFLFFLAVRTSRSQNSAPPQIEALTGAKVVFTDHGANAAGAQASRYVVLVSLDGFRWDYPREYNAANLQHMAEEGASAPEGMIPSFPSLTFPNHYTIVTGLYPGHHGIVANTFYDPARKETYVYTDAKTSGDGSWYRGTPLWALAEKQGMRSACFFWPASTAEIDGTRPTDSVNYDSSVPDEDRERQVIAWLQMAPERRPHFIAVYFSDVDHAGHVNGPDSPQTGAAVNDLDSIVGKLERDLKQLPLRVDLIVVADHGMVAREGDWIDLDRYADLSQFNTVNSLLYAPDDAAAAKAYRQLRRDAGKFKVYRRGKLPARFHLADDPREGDPVVIPTGPYAIRGRAAENPEKPPANKGEHGYDPRGMKQMRAIFFAEGPDIRAGYRLKPFENVNVYPLIAQILALQTGKIDGNLKVLRGMLRGHEDIESAAREKAAPASKTSYSGRQSTSSSAQ